MRRSHRSLWIIPCRSWVSTDNPVVPCDFLCCHRRQTFIFSLPDMESGERLTSSSVSSAAAASTPASSTPSVTSDVSKGGAPTLSSTINTCGKNYSSLYCNVILGFVNTCNYYKSHVIRLHRCIQEKCLRFFGFARWHSCAVNTFYIVLTYWRNEMNLELPVVFVWKTGI